MIIEVIVPSEEDPQQKNREINSQTSIIKGYGRKLKEDNCERFYTAFVLYMS